MHQFQNYSMNNNYQYPNNYSHPMYPQQMQNPQLDRMAQLQAMQQSLQPQQQYQQGLFGRIVDDFNAITANDVPMNGVGAVFVKKDGSEIQIRNWTANGTIATASYIPVIDNKTDDMETSLAKEETTLNKVLERFDELSQKVDGLSLQLTDIAKPKTSRTKKEED